MKLCQRCGEPTRAAFYMGFPGWACDRRGHGPIAGGAAVRAVDFFGFHGGLIVYNRGPFAYWRILWHFIIGRIGK